jgi:hypothetical protein
MREEDLSAMAARALCVFMLSVPGTALANRDVDGFGQVELQSVNGTLMVAVGEDGRVIFQSPSVGVFHSQKPAPYNVTLQSRYL